MICCGSSSLLKPNYFWQKTRQIEQPYIAQPAAPMHLRYDVSIVADTPISIISALTDAKKSVSSNHEVIPMHLCYVRRAGGGVTKLRCAIVTKDFYFFCIPTAEFPHHDYSIPEHMI